MAEFEDVKPWPDEIDRHHNEPPLVDRLLVDFDSNVRLHGLDQRVRELTASAARAPVVDSAETCGKAGDLVAAARAAKEKVEAERAELNEPLATATKALKARADALVAPLDVVMADVQASLDAYMADHPDKVRGDYGALVSAKTQWRGEIVDFAKLPLTIRRHPDVVAAAEKVVRAMVRGGEREIPGCKIWPETTATVR